MGLRNVLACGCGCALLAFVSMGCGRADGPERVLVSGQVIYDGKPVLDGRIRFIPTSGGVSPVTLTFISNGQFTTADIGGVVVGSYRVEILAYDAADLATRQAGFGQPPPRQLIPPKYNVQSQLTLEVLSGSEPIVHDFDLAT